MRIKVYSVNVVPIYCLNTIFKDVPLHQLLICIIIQMQQHLESSCVNYEMKCPMNCPDFVVWKHQSYYNAYGRYRDWIYEARWYVFFLAPYHCVAISM